MKIQLFIHDDHNASQPTVYAYLTPEDMWIDQATRCRVAWPAVHEKPKCPPKLFVEEFYALSKRENAPIEEQWFFTDEAVLNDGLWESDRYSQAEAKYDSMATLAFAVKHEREDEITPAEMSESLLRRLDLVLCQQPEQDGDNVMAACGQDWTDTQEQEDRDPNVYFEFRFKGPSDNSVLLCYQGMYQTFPVVEDDNWHTFQTRNNIDRIEVNTYRDLSGNWHCVAHPEFDRGDGVYEPDTNKFINVLAMSDRKLPAVPKHIRI